MISKKMAKIINEQITKEMYSAYLYLSMASYFEVGNLPGIATWMRVQAQEETAHGMIFFNYLADHGERALMGTIDTPVTNFKSVLAVFEMTLAHEKTVTASIYKLLDQSLADHDYATQNFLQWFVKEQVEEEKNADTIIGKLKRIGKSEDGLYMLDRELAARVFVMPAPLVAGAA
ncbi:MAG TPA: ferritin [Candidatus Ozemobacteraceae bacterium]|nr:ferritin [Candidatus Ozemobacteraceae bacterium]